MPDSDRLEVQHHSSHRKRPWWVVAILDEEDGSGEVLSTHINEEGARRKLKKLLKEYGTPSDENALENDDEMSTLVAD